LVKPI